MKDTTYLLFHLLTTIAKLIQPGGVRSVVAENLLLKQQLIIHSRARRRAPNLSTKDRALPGFLSVFLNPRRLVRSAIVIKPSTLLSFHNPLKKQKYRLLYSPRGSRKPGPKWPSNAATSRRGLPKYISSDNDPLFQYHRWKANLRVLEVEAIKSLPHVPMSHPFVERLIGSIRRELPDQALIGIAKDLENKLRDYQAYYHEHRCHTGRAGATSVDSGRENIVALNDYR